MTGDESYHAHCFTCRTCKRRIEELVFAKTSQGIYCMVSSPCRLRPTQLTYYRRAIMNVSLGAEGMRKRSDSAQRARKRSSGNATSKRRAVQRPIRPCLVNSRP